VSVYDKENSASSGLQELIIAMLPLADSRTYKSNDDASKKVAIDAIVKRKPAFIMPFGTDEFVTSMLEQIERSWTESSYRPWYIMSEGNRSNYRSSIKVQGNLVDRVIGTAPGARASEQYLPFTSDYKRYYDDEPHGPGNLAECGYDAVFLTAYAT